MDEGDAIRTRAIEEKDFPFEHLTELAELESWRKEINRPTYHLHKWWAQRLGSVFRAILLGTLGPSGSDILKLFYEPTRFDGAVIFDPFMGSGTTVGEVLKLGARAIGRDINPVPYLTVRTALHPYDRNAVVETFRAIEQDVAPLIQRRYCSQGGDSRLAEVLYFFWVMVVPCPHCSAQVDLFPSYIFAQHAYPKRHPAARSVCPSCGAINTIRYDSESSICDECGGIYKPSDGTARGATAVCRFCKRDFSILAAIRATAKPPTHRLYAKLVLDEGGTKRYLKADDDDLELYDEAERQLRIRASRETAYPIVQIEPGYNTNQILNYGYTHWHQLFNARQLLCLGLLADRIRAIPDGNLRTLFTLLFSGTLEFNNMFASFKGEGTGAVRHMFSHHILKPERTPLEANPWGTPKSSGAFSTLFQSRILRALEYAEHPFELRVAHRDGRPTATKMFGLAAPLQVTSARSFGEFTHGKSLYLSRGDSARTDLAPESVDVVVTDPPFFDNVNYSQLADFFYVWQRYTLGLPEDPAATTRSPMEVQHGDSAVFAERLGGVWEECARVLRPDGLLVFTYHHSRPEGWKAVLESLRRAAFSIVAAHPIKAELSVAQPKQQAKDPIDLDIIIVCRKKARAEPETGCEPFRTDRLVDDAIEESAAQIARLNGVGKLLSTSDVRIVLMAQVVKRLSRATEADVVKILTCLDGNIELLVSRLYQGQDVTSSQPVQLALELERAR